MASMSTFVDTKMLKSHYISIFGLYILPIPSVSLVPQRFRHEIERQAVPQGVMQVSQGNELSTVGPNVKSFDERRDDPVDVVGQVAKVDSIPDCVSVRTRSLWQ